MPSRNSNSTARDLSTRLQIESLEGRQMLAADGLGVVGLGIEVGAIDVEPAQGGPIEAIELASVRGRKWDDLNGNGLHDAGEPGLPGVTIYADLNRNGVLDRGEPKTRSVRDNPVTDFDESGLYRLNGLRPGKHLIREVVPDGFEQTFPPIADPIVDAAAATMQNEFATVQPTRLAMRLAAGQRRVEVVELTINPECIQAIQVDVVASDPGVQVANLTGAQLNGCGGDTSTFEIAFEGDGQSRRFSLQFIDTLSQNTIAEIPVLTIAPRGGGAHVVVLSPGQSVDGLDFGNRRIPLETGALQGTKWLDANGNGQRDPREPGLAGVTIYLDTNFNRRLDRGEPRTRSMRDDPRTAVDETGMYWFKDVRAGAYAVREVVPDGSVQTYPRLILFDPLPPVGPLPNGASHFVIVRPGQTVEDLDFGNRPVKPGSIRGLKWLDSDGDGERDRGEPGLAGVAIYADRNFNGRLDPGEPRTRTMRDDPNTRVDETGQYWLEDLRPGYVVIREVVPAGYEQTFPKRKVDLVGAEGEADDRENPDGALPDRAIRRNGQHVVLLGPGEEVDGIDFGNRPKGLIGDFDQNGVVDNVDIDLLSAAIRGFSMDLQFDLTRDGRVDLHDLIAMIKDVLNTDFGDANLDGRFNSTDLIEVLSVGQYEDGIDGNSGWADGDWNGDGDFDTGDLVAAFSDGGYVRAASPLVAAAVDAALQDDDSPRRRGAFV